MIRKILVLFVLLSSLELTAAPLRRRGSVQRRFPDCAMVMGTAAVTFTRDEGQTLAPSAETLTGIGYTYGLTVVDEPHTLMAWHKSDLLLSRDDGCSWRVVGTFDDYDFPPRLVAARGGRVYAWSDNRTFLLRYDARGAVRLKQPVAFMGFAALRENGDIVRGAGTDGSIWQSTDAGETWEQIGSLRASSAVGFYRFAFDPDDLDHIVAGAAVDGTYYTYDGGRIWRRSAGLGAGAVNAFEVAFSPVNGEVVWVEALDQAQDMRHIYRSTDGGRTFEAVVDDAPPVQLTNGNLMVPHPNDANILYFVFGSFFQGYGTDLYRYDAATKRLTITHNDNHGINSIAFSTTDRNVMYLGLEVVSGPR
jgi:photosystem II stability/assembly factor-like uncharacterized protein